jgi:hypothetical protein
MIQGFPIKVRNKEGGDDVLPFSKVDTFQMDKALVGQGWEHASENLPEAGTKAERTEAAAIYKAFLDSERACEPYAVGEADKFMAQWQAEALASGKPGDAPTNKGEVKDRMRFLKRKIRADFTAKYRKRYYTLTQSMLSAVIPELTKLAEAENKKDAANLAKFGITQTHPNPIVCGLLALRRYFIQQLVFAENSLESADVTNLNVDGDLLRALGCDLN